MSKPATRKTFWRRRSSQHMPAGISICLDTCASSLPCGWHVATAPFKLWTIRSFTKLCICCIRRLNFLLELRCRGMFTTYILCQRKMLSSCSRYAHADFNMLISLYWMIPLQTLLGRVHMCVDGWTSPNVISFLGVTAHWHKDGKIHHIILDFIQYVFPCFYISIFLSSRDLGSHLHTPPIILPSDLSLASASSELRIR